MEHSAMMSLTLQKLAELEVSRCLETPQCSCSKCKTEAAIGGFSVTDFHARSELPKRLSQSPKIAYFPDQHRCKRFPCPICNPGRSQSDGLSASAVVTPQMLQSYVHGAEQQLLRNGHHHAGVILFGDGGHTCRKFPCPVCNGRSAALAAEVGC